MNMLRFWSIITRHATGPLRRSQAPSRYEIAIVLIGVYMVFAVWSLSKSVQLDNSDVINSVSPDSTGRTLSLSHLISHSANGQNRSSRQNTTTDFSGTFVIQVRGEMGNNLQRIAHGHALKWYAEEKFQFSPQLLIRHLKKPKWRIARSDIYQCFPLLRSLDYEGALQPKFVRIQKGHPPWLAHQGDEWTEKLSLVKEESHRNITLGLTAMKDLTMLPSRPYSEYPIVVLGGPMRNTLIDKYYQRFRDELFVFDDNNDCCAQLPDYDEVVFHFRHFAKELTAEEQQSRGFEELDPERVATQLMSHLQPGQKIAITTRFANEPLVEEYQRVMRQRGFKVRIVTNQTGVQDFCFLLRTQQELLGVAKSTYARWAAYLGDAKRVQLYALDSLESQEFIKQTMMFPWSHPELTNRLRFRIFPSLSSD